MPNQRRPASRRGSAQAESANADRRSFPPTISRSVIDRASALGATFLPKPLAEKALLGVPDEGSARLGGLGLMNDTTDVVLSELELDAITELVNLGVSRAATNLARMVQEEVILTVPKVALMSRREAIRTLGERESQSLVAVHQVFEGEITGQSSADLPGRTEPRARAGRRRQRAVARGDHRARAGSARRNGQHHSEQLPRDDRELAREQPEDLAARSPARRKLASSSAWSRRRSPAPPSCSSTSTSPCRRRDINGYIAMMMDMPSLAALQTLLRALIRRTGGASKA